MKCKPIEVLDGFFQDPVPRQAAHKTCRSALYSLLDLVEAWWQRTTLPVDDIDHLGPFLTDMEFELDLGDLSESELFSGHAGGGASGGSDGGGHSPSEPMLGGGGSPALAPSTVSASHPVGKVDLPVPQGTHKRVRPSGDSDDYRLPACAYCSGPHETLCSDAVALSDLRDKARQMWAQLQWACSSRPCVVRAGAPSASDSEPQDASRLHSACRARVLGEPYEVKASVLEKLPLFHCCWDPARVRHVLGLSPGPGPAEVVAGSELDAVRLCSSCVGGMRHLFEVLRKVYSLDSQLALRRHLTTSVWPSSSSTRVSCLREVLFCDPFRIRSPELLKSLNTSMCKQLVSAVNALLTTKGEAATTAEERRALEAATMVLATPGALGSSDMVSESRAERLDPISALQLRMVHMGLRP